MANVYQFKPRNTQPTVKSRLFAVAMYGLLGYLLYNTPVAQTDFTLFVVLGLVYWVFIRRHVIETSYFLRYHYLQATFLFLLMYGATYLLLMLFYFGTSLLDLLHLSGSLGSTLVYAPATVNLVYAYAVLALGISQAVLAGLGQTPRLPVITPNVIYWA